jgi:hypothetical protein
MASPTDDVSLEKPLLAMSVPSFKLVATDLELDHERISSKVIDIDGYGVDVDGSGSVSVSGSDELDYQGMAEIVSKQGFVTNLFSRLAGATLKDGCHRDAATGTASTGNPLAH